MTVTDQSRDQLVAALLADPDFLDSLRSATRARAERPFFNMAGERIDLLAATPVGRVQVSPGQTISSASWGNPVWDQSINCFASTTDRDSQWPTPHEGSECYTVDTGSPWVYRSGAWHGRPKGFIGSVIGPATQTDAGATAVNVLSLPVTLVQGRRYRVEAQSLASQQTATGNPVSTLADTGGYIPGTVRVFFAIGLAGGVAITGSGVWTLQATATATVTFSLTGSSSSGVCRFGASSSQLTVEDIGS